MKALLNCLLFLFCFRVNGVYSQPTPRLSIPVLKENTVVDSILNALLDNHLEPMIGRKLTYQWLAFDIHLTAPNHYHFNAFSANRKGISFFVNKARLTKTQFGYFSYRNVLVFVKANENFSSFYKTTIKSTPFNFLQVLKDPKPTSDIVAKKQEFWDYDYKNGKFIASKVPVVR
jgi:hypothetical protein